MEKYTEVKTYQIDYKCPECNDGYLRPSGFVYMSHPVQYPHICNICQYTITLDKSYPILEHIKINELCHNKQQ